MLYRNLLPFAFFLIGLGIISLLAVTQRNAEIERHALETRITGEQVQLRLEECLNVRTALIQSLANREWSNQAEVLRDWPLHAGPLIKLYPGVQALNYIDDAWTIRVVTPSASNLAALNKSLRDNPNPSVIGALEIAEASSEMQRTDIIDLLQGGKGFTIYQRFFSVTGEPLGYINGVYRVNSVLQTCLAESNLSERFRWALFETNGARFHVHPNNSRVEDWPMQSSFDVRLASRPWKMVFAPSSTHLGEINSNESEYLLLAGVILVGLLTLLFRLLVIKQASLRESEDRYRMLVENQSDMVIQVDLNQKLAYASPSFCRAMGRSEQSVLGSAIWEYVEPTDTEVLTQAWQKIMQPPYRTYHEARNPSPKGNRWVAWSSSAMLDNNGNITGITSTGRDITDIRSLEERVSHAQKMKAIGEMAGGITHDFNNLLQVLLGNIEFLKSKSSSADQDTLAQIEQIVERAMALTRKLATLSRQQPVSHRVIELMSYLDEFVELLKRTLPADISIQLIAPPSPIHIQGDPTQIEQVLLNLCFNARDAISDSGSIKLSLTLEHLDEEFCKSSPELVPGEYACIAVRDDGEGIAPEILQRIFDPFFTTKLGESGTGLGLANCDSIVRQHAGTIVAASQPGEGTTMTIYLPTTEPEELQTTSPDHGEQPTQRSGVILVADDDQEVLRLISLILTRAGYEVIEAANGHDAVVAFDENQDSIVLVILDLVMPVMDGGAAAAKIIDMAPDTRILFASGYAPEGVRFPYPVLKKPFKTNDLLEMIQESLNQ